MAIVSLILVPVVAIFVFWWGTCLPCNVCIAISNLIACHRLNECWQLRTSKAEWQFWYNHIPAFRTRCYTLSSWCRVGKWYCCLECRMAILKLYSWRIQYSLNTQKPPLKASNSKLPKFFDTLHTSDPRLQISKFWNLLLKIFSPRCWLLM